MHRSATICVILAFAFSPTVWAQPAPKASSDSDIETVIVTAPSYPAGVTPNTIAHDFIQNYAAPAPFLGKFSRWNKRNPICPSAAGFPSGYSRFMVDRIKEIAELVHAPISYALGCKPNLAVIVTKDAQGLMNEIRSHRTDLLGYYTSDAQADLLATMHFPVQVLYETATIDVNGHVVRDSRGGTGASGGSDSGDVSAGSADSDSGGNTPGGAYMTAGDYPSFAVTGLRARDGLESAFFNVTIVVDAAKVDRYRLQLDALADYLSMVALAQTENFTPCEQVPSVSSLMTPNCATSGLAHAITPTDIAYLMGLYTMDGGGSAAVQSGGIAAEVKKSLTGGK